MKRKPPADRHYIGSISQYLRCQYASSKVLVRWSNRIVCEFNAINSSEVWLSKNVCWSPIFEQFSNLATLCYENCATIQIICTLPYIQQVMFTAMFRFGMLAWLITTKNKVQLKLIGVFAVFWRYIETNWEFGLKKKKVSFNSWFVTIDECQEKSGLNRSH